MTSTKNGAFAFDVFLLEAEYCADPDAIMCAMSTTPHVERRVLRQYLTLPKIPIHCRDQVFVLNRLLGFRFVLFLMRMI